MKPNPATTTWPQAMATVTACKYEFGAGRALAFGAPTSKHFRITFNYWVPNAEGTAELHTDQFTSEHYLPQGHLFPITYDPDQPHQNSHSAAASSKRAPVLAFGIIGSVLLSLGWLAVLRGCR